MNNLLVLDGNAQAPGKKLFKTNFFFLQCHYAALSTFLSAVLELLDITKSVSFLLSKSKEKKALRTVKILIRHSQTLNFQSFTKLDISEVLLSICVAFVIFDQDTLFLSN